MYGIGLLWYDSFCPRYNYRYLRIWNMRVQINQMKFLAMCIISQKLSFDVFTEENVKNVFMEHDVW